MSDQTKEILIKRVRDASVFPPSKPIFIGFFDEFDAARVQNIAEHGTTKFCSFGGYDRSERRMLGFFPDNVEPTPEFFPIIRLTAVFYGDRPLSHKDFLGALINGGIKRGAIGDIFVFEKSAEIFVKSELAPYIADNITYVGGSAVKFTVAFSEFIAPEREYEQTCVTVSSYRADALIAAVSGISRSSSLELINSGRTFLNGLSLEDPVKQIKDGDVLTVRGKGKYLICFSGRQTKKGRYKINVKKYK